MSYTKGEWKYKRPQILVGGDIICSLTEPHYMPDCGDRTWYNGCVEVMEANASLIAAAPAILEALEKIRAITPNTIIYDIASKAIAQVEKSNEGQ